MQLIVHGGAGGVPDEPGPRQGVLESAAEAGADEAAPLAAVEAAIRHLESSPRFNAGVGSCTQSDGIPRTDAGVMTDDREAGAACAMPGVEHAVSVARIVHDETPHVLLSGVHAVDLADESGLDVATDLWSDSTRERWADLDPPGQPMSEQLTWVRERFGSTTAAPDDDGAPDEDASEATGGVRGERGGGSDHRDHDTADHRDHDTVGAVARDGDRIAAATSTGGRWAALAGRVGDVPQIGSGFYAAPAAGASATGAGEDIARVTLSRRAVQFVEGGADAETAAERAIDEFDDLTGSSAGVIVADAEGGLGSAYNSEGMQTATVTR